MGALPMKKPMKAAAMKAAAMKKAGPMKTMKAMKAKRVSVIAKGKSAKARVFSGTKEKLMKNKSGKVVSKKASAHGKKQYVKNGLKAWAYAVKKARKELGLTGFVAVGGKSAAGKALYAKAKSLL